jgi:hypothetical protein
MRQQQPLNQVPAMFSKTTALKGQLHMIFNTLFPQYIVLPLGGLLIFKKEEMRP